MKRHGKEKQHGQKHMSKRKEIILGIQHLAACFGATTLVPLLTGLSISVALLTAGLGTLIFHSVTKGKVPIFLGSSFAFIPGIIAVAQVEGLPAAQGGIVVAGLIYLVLALGVYKLGVRIIQKVFPSYVVGSMIIIVGLSLIPTAVGMASDHILVALVTIFTFLLVANFGPGFSKQLSILIAIVVGSLIAFAFGLTDFSSVSNSPWIQAPSLTLPRFTVFGIMTLAPVVLATFMEHIGDIAANQAICEKDFMKDPGLHRTLIGDGLATAMAGMIGGPANTTYSENTALLKITKNSDPKVLRLTAFFAILLAFSGKLSNLLGAVHVAVLGGVSVILFLSIARIGYGIVKKEALNLSKIIVAIIMIFIGLAPLAGFAVGIPITVGVSLSGTSLAALFGVFANAIIQKVKKYKKEVRF